MDQIGVRELRQHASRYLARVERGENLEITDRGRPVARLVPVSSDLWERLLASGQVLAPTGDGDVLDERPGGFGIDASGRLAAMRNDER
jgi:prevent-host-death family protein